MTLRILLPELRRTLVLPVLLGFLAVAGFLAEDSMNRPWPGLVLPVLHAQQGNLALLWPLALVLGFLVGGRDTAAGVSELLSTTPRRWAPVVPRAVLLGLGPAVAYLVAPSDQLFLAARAGAQWPSGWVWPLLVGALSVAAAGLLGLALGRRFPSRIYVVPVLIGIVAVTVLVFWLGNRAGSPNLAKALLLFPASFGDDAGDYAVIAGRTTAGQALWFLALTGAAFLLYSASGRRRGEHRRTTAVTALVLIAGLVPALLLLPTRDQAQAQDAEAAALVCADGLPRVCVTRSYEKALPELLGPARAALSSLAKLPNPPTAVLQDNRDPRSSTRQSADTVLVDLVLDHDGHLVTSSDSTAQEDILAGAGALWCSPRDDRATLDREYADRIVAAAWLAGRSDPPTSGIDAYDQLMTETWTALHQASPAEQVTRVAALRQARLECRGDATSPLLGP